VNTAMNVFKFRKMWGFFIFNSWPAGQEELCSTDLSF
jgi:hypothetical protein